MEKKAARRRRLAVKMEKKAARRRRKSCSNCTATLSRRTLAVKMEKKAARRRRNPRTSTTRKSIVIKRKTGTRTGKAGSLRIVRGMVTDPLKSQWRGRRELLHPDKTILPIWRRRQVQVEDKLIIMETGEMGIEVAEEGMREVDITTITTKDRH